MPLDQERFLAALPGYGLPIVSAASGFAPRFEIPGGIVDLDAFRKWLRAPAPRR